MFGGAVPGSSIALPAGGGGIFGYGRSGMFDTSGRAQFDMLRASATPVASTTPAAPASSLRHDFKALLAGLAKDDDFYLGEAIGNAIAWRPRKDLAPLAELCAAHPHFQAKEAGLRALEAIKKLT